MRLRPEAEISPAKLFRDVAWSVATGISLYHPIFGAYFLAIALLDALRLGEPNRIVRALSFEAGLSSVIGAGGRRRSARLSALADRLAGGGLEPRTMASLLLSKGITAFLQGRWKDCPDYCRQAEQLLRDHCVGDLGTRHGQDLPPLGAEPPGRIRHAGLRAAAGDPGLPRTGRAVCPDEHRQHPLADPLPHPGRPRGGLPRPAGGDGRMPAPRLLHPALQGALQPVADRPLPRPQPGGLGENIASLAMAGPVAAVAGAGPARFDPARRARCALAAAATAADRARLLRCCRGDVRRLRRQKAPWAAALAVLVEAGIASTTDQRCRAVGLLRDALQRLEAVQMQAFVAAARYCLGSLLGGEEGAAHLLQAGAWMKSQGIKNPAAWR